MSEANQPVEVEKRRGDMPETSKWIDQRRREFGAAHVNDCIRRGLKGERGAFYAIEDGHVLGAPFPAGTEMAAWQDYAVATGCKFAAFIATPKTGGVDGAH